MNPNRIHHTKFLLPDASIKYAIFVYLDTCGRGLSVEESIKVSLFEEKKNRPYLIFFTYLTS